MDVVAVSGETLGAGLGALLTGLGAIIAGFAALRKAKAEATATAEADCNDRLIEVIDRHMTVLEKAGVKRPEQ